MSLSTEISGRALGPDDVRMLQNVFARIQSEGHLLISQDRQEAFAAYLLRLYLRGLVIEDNLYKFGIVAAKCKFQNSGESAADRTPNDLTLRRVLIVEDDFYLASQIQSFFEQAGAVVLGPIASQYDALTALESDVPDLAIIDLNLGSGPDFRVAEHFVGHSVPVFVVSGYRRIEFGNIPTALENVPWLEKPIGRDALLHLASQALENPSDA